MHFDPELHEAHFGSVTDEEHQERNSVVGKPWISEVSIENPPDIDDGEIVGHSVFGAPTRETEPLEHPSDTDTDWMGAPFIPSRDKEIESPVGMGSAMYDLGAIMGDDHGVRIVPSSVRSEQALNMWAKNEGRGYWPSPSPVQTGELMDIAFQLLKEERRWVTPLPSEANPNPKAMTTEEYQAHEEQRKEEKRARAAAGEWQLRDADGNLHPDYVGCPTCNGQGFRDEYSGDPEHGGETCYHCYGHGVVHRTEEENRPIDDLMGEMVANPTPETMQPVQEYFAPDKPERVFPEGFQDVMTGEPMDIAWRLLKGDDRHTLPEGVYSPKNVNAYVEEHKGELGGLTRLHTTDHFYDQAVNRGLIPLKYHRGKMQQIQKGKGNIFNPTGTRGGVNTVGYIQNVIKLFLHQHGISHPSQLPADGIGIHLGDRGGDIFHDKTKEYRMSHDGYTPIVAQRKNHPDEFALTTVYGDEDSPHADKPLKGRTYSLFDENPHRGEKYKSEPLQPNFRIPIMSRKGSVDSDANTHMITEPALGFLKEHFGSDEHLHHNGNPLLKFPKPRGGDGGHRVDWAGGGLPKDGWNIGMEKTAGSIGSALQELQTNYQLGMTEDPDALDALGGDMFQAWKGVHDAKGAGPWDYNSITMPENTPGWFGGDDALKGTPFEMAWQLLKAPFVTPDRDEVIDQPLYSGGDAGDDPKYWTKNLPEALDYALYGSAVLNDTSPENIHGYDRNFYPEEQDYDEFTPPPLRETVPTIFRADPHPTSEDEVHLDPEANDWYRNYISHDLAHERLPDEEVMRLINERLEDEDEGVHFSAGFTSGQYYPPERREAHVRAALERLKNKQAGNLSLPEDTKYDFGWSETDEKKERV